MNLKIADVEPKFAQKLESGVPVKNILHELGYHIPDNFQARISLLDSKGRKKRSSAAAENWSWESGRIELRFEPTASAKKPAQTISGTPPLMQGAIVSSNQAARSAAGAVNADSHVHLSEAELLRVLAKTLDRAEARPGWNFVPLKKFRDEILPAENPALTDAEWHSVLRSAIEKRLVLVGRVPNPKAPEFPVSTVRLNRLISEVAAMIGKSGDPDLDFHPVEIRGEPLSATILRERR
jgi:hypothetical protein